LASLLQKERPTLVIVGALAPGGLTQARYLCRRLRSELPSAQVVVGRWGRGPRKARKLLVTAGADRVVTTLREAGGQLKRAPGGLSSAVAGSE
jgi:hypothetical protein